MHFYGVGKAGEVFIYTVPEKYLYIGLHLFNTFPGQKKAIVVFKYTSPAPEKYLCTHFYNTFPGPKKYLYTPCRRSIYTLLRRRESIYIHKYLDGAGEVFIYFSGAGEVFIYAG